MDELTTIVPQEPADEAPQKRGGKRGGWFVTDAELIERMGVPEKIARQAIQALDNDPRSGFPRKQKLWGDRRLRSAVKAYLKHHCGFKIVGLQGSSRHDR